MAKSTEDSRNNVTLEELLRFKRAERPDETFWEQFDGELHQRMMQTLVKKDPWSVQLLRGLTGKLAQTTGIAALAAFLALMVIRPAFVSTNEQSQSAAAMAASARVSTSASVSSVPAPQVLDTATAEVDSSMMADADYGIEVLSVSSADNDATLTHDFELDHLDVASYDIAAYSADISLPGFTSTGVASLVY